MNGPRHNQQGSEAAAGNGRIPGLASTSVWIPQRRERIERTTAGVTIRGTVEYSDQLQVLVKWDDGQSNSLRVGRDRFRAQPDKRGEETAP
jgi:hypothetical protein